MLVNCQDMYIRASESACQHSDAPEGVADRVVLEEPNECHNTELSCSTAVRVVSVHRGIPLPQ